VAADQLRSLNWTDYRKLTRGLAAILFSPAELATRSVTGQRWSRAGLAGGYRPIKPALDRAKVQAIISESFNFWILIYTAATFGSNVYVYKLMSFGTTWALHTA
jgi:hypothetical protein